MGKITFALIRSKNPEVASSSNGGVEEVESLNLSGCEILVIENLDLFHHIKELDLSNNRISRIEELLLMNNLQMLDISNNFIDSEGLRASIANIPKSLVSINLSGNPCATDLDLLGEFQDAFPDLVIAIEEETKEEKEDQEEEETKGSAESDEDKESDPYAILTGGPLNADDVLKMIVDRKCKLQNHLPPSFNLQSTVEQLNEEMKKAIESTNNRKIRLMHSDALRGPAEDTRKRIDELLVRSQTGESAVLGSMQKSANEKLQEIHAKHVRELDSQLQQSSV